MTKPSPNPATHPSDTQALLAQLREELNTGLMSDAERQAYHEQIKSDSYMRWLAFYYLGRREQSQHELKNKLLAKGCDPKRVALLLKEFAEEGYQSDERMTTMLIKEGLGKGYGRQRIYQALKKHGLTTIASIRGIDDWVTNHPHEFTYETLNPTTDEPAITPIADDASVDWLELAVATRVKKFGDKLPIEAKEKARQLRFLQYRGFAADVCFDAIKHTLDSLAER